MRRDDRAITDPTIMEGVLKSAPILRLGLVDQGQPYIVPLNFGYRDGFLYFHSADKGRKIDVIRRSPEACFEASEGLELVKSDQACGWGMRFLCVMGTGRAEFLENPADRKAGLDAIMEKYSGRPSWDYDPAQFDRVAVIRVKIATMTCKKHP
jgi:uncharacterized protein